nr:hypothetical protein [Azospirillum brasilense]
MASTVSAPASQAARTVATSALAVSTMIGRSGLRQLAEPRTQRTSCPPPTGSITQSVTIRS